MKPYLCEHKVVANVRNEGSIGTFSDRTFDLMLTPATSEKMKEQAIRVLCDRGYETNRLTVLEHAEL